MLFSAWVLSMAQALPEQVTKSNNSFMDCEGQPVLTTAANILNIIAAIAQLAATAVGLHQRARANVSRSQCLPWHWTRLLTNDRQLKVTRGTRAWSGAGRGPEIDQIHIHHL